MLCLVQSIAALGFADGIRRQRDVSGELVGECGQCLCMPRFQFQFDFANRFAASEAADFALVECDFYAAVVEIDETDAAPEFGLKYRLQPAGDVFMENGAHGGFDKELRMRLIVGYGDLPFRARMQAIDRGAAYFDGLYPLLSDAAYAQGSMAAHQFQRRCVKIAADEQAPLRFAGSGQKRLLQQQIYVGGRYFEF